MSVLLEVRFKEVGHSREQVELSGLRDEDGEDDWGQMTPGQALATKFILTAAQEIEDRVGGSGTNESTFERLNGGSILLMFEIDSDKAPSYSFLYEIDPLGRYRIVYRKGAARPRDAVKVGKRLWAEPDWSAPVTDVDLQSAGGE